MEQTTLTQNDDLFEKSNKSKIILGWILAIGSIVGLWFCLGKLCQTNLVWVPYVLLGVYAVALLVNGLNKNKRNLWWLFMLAIIALPVILAFFTTSWSWWIWLLVVGGCGVVIVWYFIGLLTDNLWGVVLPVNVFFLLMLIILQRYG